MMHKTPKETSLRLSVAATYSAAAGQHYPRHRHTTWELIYYRSGHIGCVLEGRTVATRPGMVLIIPPHTFHFDYARSAYSQIYLRLERRPPLPNWPDVTFDDGERTFGYLFGALTREWRAPPSPEQGELLSLLVR